MLVCGRCLPSPPSSSREERYVSRSFEESDGREHQGDSATSQGLQRTKVTDYRPSSTSQDGGGRNGTAHAVAVPTSTGRVGGECW